MRPENKPAKLMMSSWSPPNWRSKSFFQCPALADTLPYDSWILAVILSPIGSRHGFTSQRQQNYGVPFYRQRNGLFRSTTTVKTLPKSLRLHAEFYGPVGCAHGLAVKGQHDVAVRVAALLGISSPAAITWPVIAVLVRK